ncbi:hypothetical protein ACFQGT_12850 [Natrialbaceae archaeon GCM10025810]|uniref:hypothetical protein n=1 Tax=Halovalidus salilacus TaxID=3075124 RepID=UPI003611A432
MTELSRRRLLAASGVAMTGALAGCSSDDGDDGDDGDRGDEADDEPREDSSVDDGNGDDGDGGSDADAGGTVLGDITIENLDDRSHDLDVLVEFGEGEDGWSSLNHWSSYDLEGRAGESLERDWRDDPARFRVTARLDGEEITSVTPGKWNDPGCLNLLVLIDRDGSLSITSDTAGGPCSADEVPDEDE